MDIGYYNKVFTESQDFNCHYENSKHYPMWRKAIEWVNDGIIELGCGTGQFANMLHDYLFKDYHGFDYSDEGIKKCIQKKLGDFKFTQKDIYSIKKISANTILAMEFFEHVEKDLLIIDRIEPGCKVIFSVPDFKEPSHVRIFRTFEEITNRYGAYLHINEIICYPERNLKRFLVNSIKK